MGLMDFLEPFATGYLETRVGQMQARAQERAEKRKLEDELKAREASAIRTYAAQAQIEADVEADKLSTEQKRLISGLRANGMSEDLITILGPQLYDTDTYNDYVARNHKNNDNWFKETLDLPEFGFRGTMQEFIIQGNKNSQQENNTKNITNNLGKEQGLDSQPNALKVLTQDVEGITRESPFAPSFDYTPEQLEAQRAQQVALTGPLPQQEAIFAFSGLPAVSSYVSKSAIDVSQSERNSRDRNIGREIANSSGFGEARFDTDGNFIGGITNETELLKFRTMRNFANAEAIRFENEENQFLQASELAEKGINQIDLIDRMAQSHADGLIYDMTTRMAVNEGIINNAQALQREIYEDIQSLQQSGVGAPGIEYYLLKLNKIDTELAQTVSMTAFTKPQGYDNVLELLDEKMLQDITEGEEDIFNDNGETIEEKKETPTTQELTQSDVLRREALKKKKSRSGLTEMETEELNRLEPTEIKAPPTNEELRIELEQLKRGKKTKAAKERIKEIETILAEGN
jgi:hypothetical protein